MIKTIILTVCSTLIVSLVGFIIYSNIQKKQTTNPNVKGVSTIQPNIVNSPIIEQATQKPYKEELQVDKGIQEARKECSAQITERLSHIDNLGSVKTNDLKMAVNLAYGTCLTNKGYPAEDLISDAGSDNSESSYDNSSNFQQTQNMLNQQDCQEKQTKYQECINEYNLKFQEYETCLNDTYDPNSYRYGQKYSCYKPYNSCFKPLCS